jgi:hypothetical protein
MMMKLIVACAATVLSLGAMAGDDDKSATGADASFKSLDRDTDQRLSKTEASGDKMLTEHFAAIDADSDGFLTKREYTAHMKEMKGETTKKRDY